MELLSQGGKGEAGCRGQSDGRPYYFHILVADLLCLHVNMPEIAESESAFQFCFIRKNSNEAAQLLGLSISCAFTWLVSELPLQRPLTMPMSLARSVLLVLPLQLL